MQVAQPDAETVKTLEVMLQKAQRGEVRGVAIVAADVSSDGVSLRWHAIDKLRIIAGLHVAADLIVRTLVQTDEGAVPKVTVN